MLKIESLNTYRLIQEFKGKEIKALSFLSLANDLNKERKKQKAEEVLCKAIKLKPDFAKAYHLRGFLRYEQMDLTGALLDFQKASELNPFYH